MALFEMVMPKMGESIMEGTVLRWLKKIGDKIEQDESVLEVATDKVDTEVPAVQAGYLMDILVKEGEVVPIGATIALISTTPLSSSKPVSEMPPQIFQPTITEKPIEIIESQPVVVETSVAETPVMETYAFQTPVDETPEIESIKIENEIEQLVNNTIVTPVSTPENGIDIGSNPFLLPEPAAGRFYSPLVLTIAREEKISMQELEFIAGTGGDNRVTKKDIINYVNFKKGILPETEIPVLQPLISVTEPVVEEIKQPELIQESVNEEIKLESEMPPTDYKSLINLEKTYPVKEEVLPTEIAENQKIEQEVLLTEEPEEIVTNTSINLDKTVLSDKPVQEEGEIIEIVKLEDKVLTIPLEKITGNFISLDKPYSQSYEVKKEELQPVAEVKESELVLELKEQEAVTEEPKKESIEVTIKKQEPEKEEVEKQESEKQEVKYFKSEPEEPVESPAISVNGKVEIIEMDRMRKMIAQRMVDSKRISPHVTSFVEADVTNIVFWRNKVKDQFKASEGENITFTPVFIEALAKALRDFPMVNISVDGDKILVKKDINIGMAVALPNGNLIVPVIQNADQYNLVGLTKKVNDLAKRARENKLKLEDLEGGTYTMSNIGSFGNVMGTPIIMQPQVAIMSFGAVQKKPAVIETPYGDTLGIRQLMFLSHSYDHRVVDGALGGMFVRRVADYLENFDVNRKVF